MRNGDSTASNVGATPKRRGGSHHHLRRRRHRAWDHRNNEAREGTERGSRRARITRCGVSRISCTLLMLMLLVLLLHIHILRGGKEGGLNLLYLGITRRFDYAATEAHGDGARERARRRGWHRC